MSPLPLGILAASGAALGANHWIASLENPTSTTGANGIASDSLGNIYVAGYNYAATGYTEAILAKYDTDGALAWQKSLSSSLDDRFYGITIDGSDNIYVLGETQSMGGYNQHNMLIAKFNTAGTLQWQKSSYSSSNDANRSGWQIAHDSSGNVYIAGSSRYYSFGSADYFVAKYNSSGTLQWQKMYGGSSDDTANGLAVDSSGNVYVTGYSESAGNYRDIATIKIDSSGNLQWQRLATSSGSNQDQGYGVALDSSGNVYVSGFYYDSAVGYYVQHLLKYNSSGTLQWEKAIGQGTNHTYGRGVTIDANDNIYTIGYSGQLVSSTSGWDMFIAKWDTSGTIQWQRGLGAQSTDFGYSISTDPNGDVLVTGLTYSTPRPTIYLAKLPADGSKTGSYLLNTREFSYVATSNTLVTSGLTHSTPSFNFGPASMSTGSSSLTLSTSSLVEYITEGSPYAVWLTDTPLPVCENGVAYSQTFAVVVESMGTTVSYSLLSGSFPGGMTFNSDTATLSGSSTESAGTESVFTLRAVASNGLTVDKEFSLATVMSAKITGSNITVINVSPYTHQYYAVKDSTTATVTSSLTNVSFAMVGGGASGTYVSGSASTYGGYGGTVRYASGLSLSATTYSLTVGSGGSYTFGNSNPGSATSGFGYTASGGSGTTQSGINGSNSGSSVMTPIATELFGAGNISAYTGLDTGYLGGSGSGGTTSATPRTPGLGGGGHGIYYDNSPQAGCYLSGGGGGGGGQSGASGSVGQGGGKGVIVIAVPNQ